MENRKKISMIVIFILTHLTLSCQSISYNTLDFGENDVVIYKTKYSNDYISIVEIIVKLDERAEGVQRVEDFHDLYLGFGYFDSTDTYHTKGQQFFRPTRDTYISKDGVVLLDIKYEQEKYLYLKMDILSLKLKKIDDFYIWFFLNDEDRSPRLRYNTEAFFYKSEKAKELNFP